MLIYVHYETLETLDPGMGTQELKDPRTRDLRGPQVVKGCVALSCTLWHDSKTRGNLCGYYKPKLMAMFCTSSLCIPKALFIAENTISHYPSSNFFDPQSSHLPVLQAKLATIKWERFTFPVDRSVEQYA